MQTSRDANTFDGFPPSGLMTCPMCDYPLDGLPATHACPECGFQYDPDTHVWKARTRRSLRVGFVGLSVFEWVLLAALIATMPPQIFGPGIRATWAGLITLHLVGSILIPVLTLRMWRDGTMAGINPEGVFVRVAAGRVRRIPLDDITDVVFRKELVGSILYVKRAHASAIDITTALATASDREAFADVARRRLHKVPDNT